jgi:hypothetical protein
MALFRGIVQGQPGSGKTSLACALANEGYRVVRCAFEAGDEVFQAYCTPEGLARVHNFTFEDDWDMGDNGLERVARGMTAFEGFIYNGKIGREQPLGPPREWDARTVVMVDTITTMGLCASARALKINPNNSMLSAYEAGRDQESMAQLMTSEKRGYHVLWLSHLRLISPKAESGFKSETELQKQLKRERAALEDTGYFPTAVTPGIARNFVGHFPFALLCEEDQRAKHASKRVVRTQAVPGYQIKCPLAVPDKLPVESALLTIFSALGNKL